MTLRRPKKPRGYIVDARVAFVPHPVQAGWWVRTHPCVVTHACPQCKAKKLEPCFNQRWSSRCKDTDGVHTYSSQPHAWRRCVHYGRPPYWKPS